MKIVDGKTAFITGGASGIGFGMARAFLDAGMNVVIADVRDEALETAANHLRGYNRPFHLIKADVTDRAAMFRAAEEVKQTFGNVHLLCNNAGVVSQTSIDEIGPTEWDWIVDINLNGVMNGIMAFLPGMKAHGEGGHIVNTSSMAGILPLPAPAGAYSAVKFAVRGLSDSLRLALAYQNIGVSTLCPGLVRSNLMVSTAALFPQSVTQQVQAVQPDPASDAVIPNGGGMDAREFGEHVLQGVRDNAAYILPHGEFLAEARDLFIQILDSFALTENIDPGRLEFEAKRREQTLAAARAAAAIG